jgi:hypothetical protein
LARPPITTGVVLISDVVHQRLVDGQGADAHGQRIAVGRGLGQLAHADIAARAGFVLDHERLAQRGRQLGGDQARDGIHAAAGRNRNEDAHRARGIGVRRLRGARAHGGQARRAK